MARFYIISVLLSFFSGIVMVLLLIQQKLFEALFFIFFSFTIIALNEKTGAFERLINARIRRKLKILALWSFFLLILILLFLTLR